MAIKQYLQVGKEETFFIIESDKTAYIISQYGADLLYKVGKLFYNEDLFFIETDKGLLSADGDFYFAVNKQTAPTEPSYLLLESGDFVLLEDESKILLQR